MGSAVHSPGAVGRALFREIAQAKTPRAVAAVLRAYLEGPSQEDAVVFLAAYLCRTSAGFIPDPDQLDP